MADVVLHFKANVVASCDGLCASLTNAHILLNKGDSFSGAFGFINGDLTSLSGIFQGLTEAGGDFNISVATKLRSSSFSSIPARTIEVGILHAASTVIGVGSSGSASSDFRFFLDEDSSESISSANGVSLRSLGISYRFKPLAAAADCDAGGDAFHLQNGRFKVDICWNNGDDQGTGRLSVRDGDGATVWFFNPSNPEIFLKILDACVAPFDRFWVFVAGLTNVGVTVKVTDVPAGVAQIYENSPGNTFESVQDTTSFATCP